MFIDIWSLSLAIMIQGKPMEKIDIWRITEAECVEKIKSEFKNLSLNNTDVTVFGVCTLKEFHYRTIKIRCTKRSDDGQNQCSRVLM